MTREDIEQLNIVDPFCFESDREELWYNVGLKDGLYIADKYPKSSWINCKDKLPYEFENLLEGTRYTVNVLVYNAEENSIDTDWMYLSVYDNNIIWKWFDSISSRITHWMPLPDKPKM